MTFNGTRSPPVSSSLSAAQKTFGIEFVLHDPHADVRSPNCRSAVRMSEAIAAVLDLSYRLSATTFDFTYLDHFCSLAWYTAGTAIIRFLAANTAAREEVEVERLSQELAMIRYAALPSIDGF